MRSALGRVVVGSLTLGGLAFGCSEAADDSGSDETGLQSQQDSSDDTDVPEPETTATETPEPEGVPAETPEPEGVPAETPEPPTDEASGGSRGQTEGGDGGRPMGAGGSSGSGGVIVEVPRVSFTQVEQEIFHPAGCTAGYCHGGGAGDMVWSYEALVGMDAAKPVCGFTQRVVPGDPESSILWYRVRPLELDAGEPCAEKMPSGGPPLSAEQAQLIYDWILSGAEP